ncbi:hypothetical protein O988_07641 [Pseudogymnoascus sp. VKM F-3808]|nr:hypothetical protein O988_07641 [Pseudogymnoascus sp. VKM F-3808]
MNKKGRCYLSSTIISFLPSSSTPSPPTDKTYYSIEYPECLYVHSTHDRSRPKREPTKPTRALQKNHRNLTSNLGTQQSQSLPLDLGLSPIHCLVPTQASTHTHQHAATTLLLPLLPTSKRPLSTAEESPLPLTPGLQQPFQGSSQLELGLGTCAYLAKHTTTTTTTSTNYRSRSAPSAFPDA